MTETITLISHPGQRARRGFERELPISGDLAPLAEVTDPDGTVSRFAENPHGTILHGTRIDEALNDVVIDGATVYFDGELPDNYGCTENIPDITIDDDGTIWAYFWVANVANPLLAVRGVRGLRKITVVSADEVLTALGGDIGRTARKLPLSIAGDQDTRDAGFSFAIYRDSIIDIRGAVEREIERDERKARDLIGDIEKKVSKADEYIACHDSRRPYVGYRELDDLSKIFDRIERGRDWLAANKKD